MPKPCHVYGRARTTRPGQMNKTEMRYAARLELLRHAGEIALWAFEPEKFRLAGRTYYTPDFRVVLPDGAVEFHDVKGAKAGKPYVEEDARVKIKVAAELHPYRFVIVWPATRGGRAVADSWLREVIGNKED